MLKDKPLDNVQSIIEQKNYYNKALSYMSFNKAYQLISQQVPMSKTALLRISRAEGHDTPIKFRLPIIEIDSRLFVHCDDVEKFIASYKEAEKVIEETDEYISIEEFTRMLNKSIRTTERIIKKHHIPTLMFKKHVYIKKDEVMK